MCIVEAHALGAKLAYAPKAGAELEIKFLYTVGQPNFSVLGVQSSFLGIQELFLDV